MKERIDRLKETASLSVTAVCMVLAVLTGWLAGPPLVAQPALGYDQSPLIQKSGFWITNRVAGSTSVTNWIPIDITGVRSGVAVEMEIQNVASAAANCTLYLGKSVNKSAGTNTIDQFASLVVASSGTALTTTSGHTNFFMAGAGDQSIAGYPFLWLGIVTNASATAANYMTNIVVYVRGQ